MGVWVVFQGSTGARVTLGDREACWGPSFSPCSGWGWTELAWSMECVWWGWGRGAGWTAG